MTTIVCAKLGSKTVLVSDGLTTAGTTIVCTSTKKTGRCKNFLIGVSGDGDIIEGIRYGLIKTEDIKATPRDLKGKLYRRVADYMNKRLKSPLVNNEGYYYIDATMVVCTKSKIYGIDAFGSITDYSKIGYGVIGSGKEYVIGYLECLKNLGKSIKLEDIKDAIIVASKHKTNTNDHINIDSY